MAIPETIESDLVASFNDFLRRGEIDPFSKKRFQKNIQALKISEPTIAYNLEGILATLEKKPALMIEKFQAALRLESKNVEIFNNFFISMTKFGKFRDFYDNFFSKWSGDKGHPEFRRYAGMLGVFTGEKEILDEFPVLVDDPEFSKTWTNSILKCLGGNENLGKFMANFSQKIQDDNIFLRTINLKEIKEIPHLVCTFELDPAFNHSDVWNLEVFFEDLIESHNGLNEILTFQFFIGGSINEEINEGANSTPINSMPIPKNLLPASL